MVVVMFPLPPSLSRLQQDEEERKKREEEAAAAAAAAGDDEEEGEGEETDEDEDGLFDDEAVSIVRSLTWDRKKNETSTN